MEYWKMEQGLSVSQRWGVVERCMQSAISRWIRASQLVTRWCGGDFKCSLLTPGPHSKSEASTPITRARWKHTGDFTRGLRPDKKGYLNVQQVTKGRRFTAVLWYLLVHYIRASSLVLSVDELLWWFAWKTFWIGAAKAWLLLQGLMCLLFLFFGLVD